jgi:hypothetical protein
MLNKEELLRRTNKGLDVFKHYIPTQWKTGRNFLNPLYEDRKASCNVYFDRRGDIFRFKDFGNDDYSGDCFFFVGKLKGLNCNNGADFVEILKIINRDMCLDLDLDLEYSHSAPIQQIQPVNKLAIQEELQQPQKSFSFVP